MGLTCREGRRSSPWRRDILHYLGIRFSRLSLRYPAFSIAKTKVGLGVFQNQAITLYNNIITHLPNDIFQN